MRGGTYRRGRTVVTRTDGNDMCGSILLAIFAAVFLVAIPMFNIHNENNLLTSKIVSQKVQDNVVDIKNVKNVNDIVHLKGAQYDSTVHDPQFKLNVDHGINLKRKTEYCQWKEFSTTTRHCRGGRGENEEECYDETTYHYVKNWSPYIVNSFFFNQPAAHHNPSRDPFPSHTFVSNDLIANIGYDPSSQSPANYEIDSSILTNTKGTYRQLDYTLGAIPHPPSFLTRMYYSLFGRPTQDEEALYTRYGDISSLQGTQYSKAASQYGFYYVGQGGYFFSAYEESMTLKLSKAFFGYLEGSLFDWQFGDLLSSCTPGDIRVKYYIQDPSTVSVLGIVQGGDSKTHELKTSQVISIGSTFVPATTTNHVSNQSPLYDTELKIGYAQEGSVSSQMMMDAVMYDHWLYVLFTRFLLLPWSYLMARLCGAFVGYEMRVGYGTPYPTALKYVLLSVIGMWSLIIGLCDLMIQRSSDLSSSFHEYNDKTQHSTHMNKRIMFLFTISVISFILVDRNVARLPSYGFNETWKLFHNKKSVRK